MLSREHTNAQASASRKQRLPLVYIFFGDVARVGLQHYMWNSLRLSVMHNSSVVLITDIESTTPRDLARRIERLDLKGYRASNRYGLLSFQNSYRPSPWRTSGRDLYERQNIERWFVLYDFMIRTDLQQALYVDNDVAVLTSLNDERLRLQFSKCDVTLSSLHSDWNILAPPVLGTMHDRGLSPHSNAVRLGALSDFLAFTRQLYRQKYKTVWYETSGGAGDMNLWYLVGLCDSNHCSILLQ
jgi:hypothetical protein